jgi:filamentous hemagglutinin family protein
MTRAHLIASSALAAVLAVAGEAAALPLSPVISGTNGPGPGATFNATATTLTVTQTNSRVLIDWAGFNVASGERVTFTQPSNTSIALNRVNPASFTTISGAVNANGGVWVLSPAGMLIGNGANISVGTFLASTAIADSNTSSAFLSCCSSIPFSAQPATATPSITVQAGATISANAGFVELNSPTIVQNGDVSASDSVNYTALPSRTIDFDQGPNGLKLTDFFGNVAPSQNQAT